MRYVSHHAAASRPSPDGATQRAHWELSAKRGNVEAIERLNGPRFPDAVAYLHGWFCELDAGRGHDMNGPSAITYQDIEAWARLTDRQPEPHEVAALMEIDRAYRAALMDTEPTTTAEPKAPTADAWPTRQVTHG